LLWIFRMTRLRIGALAQSATKGMSYTQRNNIGQVYAIIGLWSWTRDTQIRSLSAARNDLLRPAKIITKCHLSVALLICGRFPKIVYVSQQATTADVAFNYCKTQTHTTMWIVGLLCTIRSHKWLSWRLILQPRRHARNYLGYQHDLESSTERWFFQNWPSGYIQK